MLFLSTKLYNVALMSIRTGGRIGSVIEPIINPHNLHIDGFYCETFKSKNKQIVLDMQIRDISNKGIIINSQDDPSDEEELVRLKPILELDFKLEGKTVIAGKKKVGKVAEYSIDQDSLFVQKIYVHPPAWKGITTNRLTFGRNSIKEVTDTHILVNGPEVKIDVNQKQAIRQAGLVGYSANTSLMSEKE